jgi:hypothetical protein
MNRVVVLVVVVAIRLFFLLLRMMHLGAKREYNVLMHSPDK